MTWAALDDKFHGHRKLALLGPMRLPCAGLHAIAISWAADHLSDGVLPFEVVLQLAGTAGVVGESKDTQADAQQLLADCYGAAAGFGSASGQESDEHFDALSRVKFLVSELLRVKLWDDNGDGTYTLHDYLDYNPSRREVLKRRRDKEKAGRRGGQASAQARATADVKQLLDLCLRSGSSRTQHPSPPLPSPSVRKNVNVGAHAPEPAQNQEPNPQADALVDDILAVTRDPHSRPFYGQLVEALPRDLVLAALSETRQAVAEKRVRKTPGRLFTFLVRQAVIARAAAKGRDSPPASS